MKPTKLRRDLEITHQDLRENSKAFFTIIASELECEKNNDDNIGSNNESSVFAPYQVSLSAKSGKSHTITEELILPYVKLWFYYVGRRSIKRIGRYIVIQ